MNDFQISSSNLHFEDWGLIDYEKALQKQLELVEMVASGQAAPTIVFCSHPPVVTLGRVTQEGDVFDWQGPTLEVSRGGRATYHGPSQLVVYAILDLNQARHRRKPKEVVGLLRDFETAMVRTLKEFGLEAQGKSLSEESSMEETGVWIGAQKVASLGIAVKKWVSYHGAAINLEEDQNAFKGMKPCGLRSEVMTSVEKLLNRKLSREVFKARLQQHLTDLL